MNGLKYLAEFQKVLKNYQLPYASSTLLSEVKLALLVAPTSSGRNTIIRQLLKTGRYHNLVSDTTRKKRINDNVLEQNGVEYFFRSEEDFLNDLKDGKFLEAAVIHNQQVSGISLRELELSRSQHKIAITDIEINGVDSVISIKPNSIVIFIVPPSFSVWQQRITKRGLMDPDEFKRRLQSSLLEFKHALEMPYYQFIINDNLNTAVEQIDHLILNGSSTLSKKNRETVEKLCQETDKYLKKLDMKRS